jgi:hypothetical protein
MLLMAAVTGCDNTNDSNAPNATASTTDVDTSSEPTESTGSTGSTGSTPSEPPESSITNMHPLPTSHDTSPPSRAKASQVAKQDLPGFNDQWSWDVSRGTKTAPINGPAASRCSRGSLTAIGGVTEYSTIYMSNASPDDQALLSVAVFPDEKTATMAASVLDTWLSKCQAWINQQPGVSRVKVTPDTPVETIVGTGHARVASYGPVKGDPDSTYFNGEGYVRDGDVISYVVFHSVGQDYNYEQGQEPAALAVMAAGDALEDSR